MDSAGMARNFLANSSNSSLSSNSGLSRHLEEALDAQHIHNDMLISLAECETRILRSIPDNAPAPLDSRIREGTLRFMSHLTQAMNLQEKFWFQAVMLFDIYCLSVPGGLMIEKIPVTCVSLLKLLKKMDCTMVGSEVADLSPLGNHLAQWLETLGHTVPPATRGLMAKSELSILQVLKWQLDVPTVESYLSIFCARANTLTQSVFMASLNWIWEQSICYARMMVIQQASTSQPPMQIAAGLLALGCVSARLLPIVAIRPIKVSAETWDQNFAECHPHGVIPECELDPAQIQSMLQLLQVSTGLSLEKIQEACIDLVPSMKKASMQLQLAHRNPASQT